MKDKITEFLKKSITSEIILKRIALYLFVICFLLLISFFKLCEIEKNIAQIAESNPNSFVNENESVADVFFEEEKGIGDYLPLYDEIEENSTSETTTHTVETSSKVQNDETTSGTVTEASTSSYNNSSKMNFVINVSSNKIHYADCSFVNRMKEENRKSIQLSKDELNEYINNGYTLCSTCGG